mgnify:CR=1 FL=1
MLQACHNEAEKAVFLCQPNPRVGCVITNFDGTLLGQGHTQKAGEAHAEIMALRDAQAKGNVVCHARALLPPWPNAAVL